MLKRGSKDYHRKQLSQLFNSDMNKSGKSEIPTHHTRIFLIDKRTINNETKV